MKNKSTIMGNLSLGRELSKNEQKKILGGGVTITCYHETYGIQIVTTGSVANCGTIDEQAYCAGTGRGNAIGCQSW